MISYQINQCSVKSHSKINILYGLLESLLICSLVLKFFFFLMRASKSTITFYIAVYVAACISCILWVGVLVAWISDTARASHWILFLNQNPILTDLHLSSVKLCVSLFEVLLNLLVVLHVQILERHAHLISRCRWIGIGWHVRVACGKLFDEIIVLMSFDE